MVNLLEHLWHHDPHRRVHLSPPDPHPLLLLHQGVLPDLAFQPHDHGSKAYLRENRRPPDGEILGLNR